MAIQMRRGLHANFDPSKMLPGEWAIAIDNDTSKQIVWMCFAPGVVKRMGTYEDFVGIYLPQMMEYYKKTQEYASSASQSSSNAKIYMTSAKTSEQLAKQYMESAFAGTPEGYAALVSKVGLMDITTTTENTVSNTKHGGLRFTKIKGNTIQNGTPSPSAPIPLLSTGDCVELMQGAYGQSDGNYLSHGAIVCSKDFIPCNVGDNISLKYEKVAYILYLLFYDVNKNFISCVVTQNGSEKIATAPTNAKYFTFNVYAENGVAITPQTVGKITLTINGKYVTPIKTHWKNFANPTRNIFVSRLGGVIASKTGFDYVATGSGTAQVVNMYIPIKENTDYAFSFKDKGYINSFGLTFVDGIGAWTNITNKVKSGNSGVHKYALLSWQLDAGYSGTISVYDVQLEVGAETDFEEYRETIAYILTNEPPRKGDFFYKENGLWRLEHNTHETRLLSEWGWSLRTNGTAGSNGVCDFQATSNDKGYASACNSEYSIAEAMCTHYPIASFYGIYSNTTPNENSLGVYTETNGEYAKFRCRNTECATLEQFKTWLAENDVRAQYKLATPIIETLDTASQIALNSLETFNGVTHIEFDSRVQPLEFEAEVGLSNETARLLKSELRNDTLEVKLEDAINTMLLLGA